jgi:hypothetical protein
MQAKHTRPVNIKSVQPLAKDQSRGGGSALCAQACGAKGWLQGVPRGRMLCKSTGTSMSSYSDESDLYAEKADSQTWYSFCPWRLVLSISISSGRNPAPERMWGIGV